MLTAHTDQHCYAPPRLHGLPRNGTPADVVQPFILTERPDRLAARISRKRCVRDSILAVHGTLKQDYLAAVLGVSRQRVARCLSERERDEFSEVHMLKLGIAGISQRAA